MNACVCIRAYTYTCMQKGVYTHARMTEYVHVYMYAMRVWMHVDMCLCYVDVCYVMNVCIDVCLWRREVRTPRDGKAGSSALIEGKPL